MFGLAMKMRLKRRLFTRKPTYIKVGLTKGESLNYMVAQWLVQYAESIFLPFTYQEKAKTTKLFYNLKDTIPLETLVKTKLSVGQYERILRDVCEVVSITTSLKRESTSLITDPAYVFVQEGTHLQFVFVPIHLTQARSTALDLITWLSDKERIQLVVNADERHRDAVHMWAQTQEVFSPEHFEAFLDREFSRKDSGDKTNQSYACEFDEDMAKQALFDPVLVATGAEASVPTVVERLSETSKISQEFFGTDAPSSQDTPKKRSKEDCLETETGPRTAATSEQSEQTPHFFQTTSQAQVYDQEASPSLVRLCDRTSYPLVTGTYILGRSHKADISLSGNTDISREHALLELTSKEVITLTDLGSANGTWVNEIRLVPQTPVTLHRGDSFCLSHEWFQIV